MPEITIGDQFYLALSDCQDAKKACDAIHEAFDDSRIGGIETLVLIAYRLYGEDTNDAAMEIICGISEPDLREAQIALKQHGLLQKECDYETEERCDYCLMKECICEEPPDALI